MRDAPRVALLDVDGVLLDSAALHRRVWDTWAARNGLGPEAVWPLTFGRRRARPGAASSGSPRRTAPGRLPPRTRTP
ncbi:hypothetical protein [Streptomyces sp. NRRL F-5630]|uniref:hypothetical protein n=1 Tax=Streptomyces sp. NRRL F-5630 TaxID=1463864 RepID=UPI003EB8CA50